MTAKNHKRATVAGAILGAVLALLATGLARAQELTEEFHHSYTLAASGSVRVKNINGGIHITAWDQNEVKVDAVKRAWSKEKLDEAKIVVESDPNSIYVWTQYPEENQNWHSDCGDSGSRCRNNPASVEYTLTVPRNARLDRISDINGGIEISGVRGEVSANSVNGRVRVNGLSAAANVSTVNGSVEAAFDRFASSSKVHSVNGRVAVTLPSDAAAEIQAHSINGSIDNDFGIPVERPRFVGRNLEGRLGAGGPRLELNTVNGSIEVRHASDGKPLSTGTSLLPKQHTLAPY